MSAELIITPETQVAIHQMIAIEGLDFKFTANYFGISEIACRRMYHAAKEEAIQLHKTKANYIREVNDLVYERVQHQANESFEKSKRPRITKTFKEVTTDVKTLDGTLIGKETKSTEEEKTEGQNGDPRFLALQLDAADKRSKLYGAEAPKRIEIDKKTTLDLYVEIADMPREERDRLAEFARLQQAGVIIVENEEAK